MLRRHRARRTGSSRPASIRRAPADDHGPRTIICLTRLPGRGVGSFCTPSTQLPQPMPRPTVELAGFLRMVWPIIIRIQFCWRTLKTPVLPPAVPARLRVVAFERTASRSVLPGSAFEIRLHARLRGAGPCRSLPSTSPLLVSAAIMSNAMRLPLAAMSASWSAVLWARMASACEKWAQRRCM